MKKKDMCEIIKDAKHIQKDHILCDSCLGRLYVKRLSLSSNRRLGKKIHKKLPRSTKCYICKDLLDNLDLFQAQIIEKIKDYQFKTFLVGIILKPSIMDRDDLIRSKYKLKVDSVKTDISKQIAKKISQKTKCVINHHNPDLTAIVNIKDKIVEVHTKTIILACRYTKNSRDMPQIQRICNKCNGKGCTVCQFHGITGFNSVEGHIARFFYKKFSSAQVKFTWIGGENRTSLVKEDGRPFFVQIINPKKRDIHLRKKIKLGLVGLSDMHEINSIPKTPLKFRSKMRLNIRTSDKLAQKDLKKIHNLKNSQIVIYEHMKKVPKSVYSAKYKKTGPFSFILFLQIDGGIPIKQFVYGKTVFPNLSDLLNTQCACNEFDFYQILIQ